MRLPNQCRLLFLFTIEVVALLAIQWPLLHNFREYAFQDTGSVLAVQSLLSRRLLPEIDFGYNYGLLPLLVGKLAFGLLGNAPNTYALIVSVVDLFVAIGFARIVISLRPGMLGWVMVLATMPIIVVGFDNLAYALEAAFLINGFAEQLNGRSIGALALALCAALSKPAMGYIYAAVLLVLAVRNIAMRREEEVPSRRSLMVLLGGGTIVVATLVVVFGFGSFVRTILPIQGIRHYQMVGKLHPDYQRFLRPPGANLNFYIGSYLAFDFVGDIWLIITAAVALFAFLRVSAGRIELFVLTAGLLVLADVAVLASHYIYVLPIGLVACGALGDWQRPTLAILGLLAAIAFLRTTYEDLNFTRTSVRSGATGYLWARADLNDEWLHAMGIAAGKRTATLAEMGAAGLVVPGIEPPVGAYFMPGNSLQPDLAREYDQLAAAEVIILFHRLSTPRGGTVLDSFPELNLAVQGAEVVYRGKSLEVRARRNGRAFPNPK